MGAGRPPKDAKAWYKAAAARMVRENLSLRDAARESGVEISLEEAATLSKRQAWQRVMYEARREYYTELGGDPGRTKQTVVGQMVLAAQKLMDEGEWDKAAQVNEKVAKIMGWVGEESEVNVFAGLSQKDLDEVKKSIGV